MNITPLQLFRASGANLVKNKINDNNPNSQNQKSPDLLGSAFAPSFKALIVKYDKNSSVVLDDKDKEEIDTGIRNLIITSRDNYKNTVLQELFDKYKDNENAMRYILTEGCENYGRYKICASDFMKLYLDNIETYFSDNAPMKEEYIEQTLLTKNNNDSTLLETFMEIPKETENAIYCALNCTDEFPELQAKILTKKEEGTNKTLVDKLEKIGEEKNPELQKRLFKLAARTDLLDRQSSIELLEASKAAIDEEDEKDPNKQALDALKSEECSCLSDYFAKNSALSFAAINSEKMKELDAISNSIVQQGDSYEPSVPLSLSPVQMAYLCLSKRSSYKDLTSRTVAITDYITKHSTRAKLAAFYAIEDNKGRLPVSAYLDNKEQLEKMNKTLAKYDTKTLYNIYMHKDKEGKTIADYLLEAPSIDENVLDEVNNALIDICSSNYQLNSKDLNNLFDTYEVLFNPAMERVKDSILAQNREQLEVIA